jgi:hypothetical protein
MVGLWRNIAADPDAYWDKARRILSKRSGGYTSGAP